MSVRFGVFANAHLEEDVEKRFTRAGVAAERTKDNPTKLCGYYKK